MFSHIVPADESGSPILNLISFAMKSKARIVIIPLQDYLELDSASRLNTPGVPSGNWEWRLKKDEFDEKLLNTVKRLSEKR